MYVLSFKQPDIKKISLCVVPVVAAFVLFLFFSNKQNKDFMEYKNRKYSICAKTNEDKIKFLSQFKLEVEKEPIEVSDIKIPTNFNSTYKEYNEIQKKQGLNLENYKGKSCKSFVYKVKNHPNQDKGLIKATIIVHNSKIIGGDISSAQHNGFMKSFVE